jgi:uncharacterized membrane protein YhaH (DUF805 family)
MGEAMKNLLGRVASFVLEPMISSGRIGRIKYLLLHVWSAWPLFLVMALSNKNSPLWMQYVLSVLVVFGLIYWWIATLTAGVRRLHDLGRSGYWVLLINLIWPLLLIWPGQRQANRYGPPVLKRSAATQIAGAA